MATFLLLLGWLSPLVFAQSAFFVDLTGDWSAELGDGTRQIYRIPRQQRLPPGSHWLRRTIEVTADPVPRDLFLTIGTVDETYEVWINERKIGDTGGVLIQDIHVGRPRKFALSQGLIRPGTNAIALHILQRRYGSNLLRVPDIGPYQLTEAVNAPIAPQAATRWRHLQQATPPFAFGLISLVLAVVLFLAWLTERSRREVLFLAIFLLCEGLRSVTDMFWQLLDWTYLTAFIRGPLVPLARVNLLLVLMGLRRRYNPWLLAATGVLVFFRIALNVHSLGIGPAPDWLVLIGNSTLLSFADVLVLLTALYVARQERNTRSVWLSLAVALTALSLLVFPRFFSEQGLDAGLEIYALPRAALAFLMTFLVLDGLGRDRREKERLRSELEAARSIQQLLLSTPQLTQPGFAIDVVYEPAQEVGGDFYYVLDGRTIVLGDVSGKGLKAAMLVSLLIGVLRETTARQPGAVLAVLNRSIAGRVDGGFVTCCAVTIDADGEVLIANAGHPSPYNNGQEIEAHTGLPLGLDPDAEYIETRITVRPGASLTILSDGVVEAANPTGELLGFDRTSAISTKPAKEIAATAKAWGQNDDITVVSVRRTLAISINPPGTIA